jgi:hypothetical protein
MKITITQEVYEELLLNLLYTYSNTINVKNKTNNPDIIKISYEFIINSSLINHRIKTSLEYHLNENYDKAYDSLMYQCDVSSNLSDDIATNLLELEYLNFRSKLKYLESLNPKNCQTKLDKYKNLFITKRNKITKFFNIDLNSIIGRLDDLDELSEKCKIYMNIIGHLLVFIFKPRIVMS